MFTCTVGASQYHVGPATNLGNSRICFSQFLGTLSLRIGAAQVGSRCNKPRTKIELTLQIERRASVSPCMTGPRVPKLFSRCSLRVYKTRRVASLFAISTKTKKRFIPGLGTNKYPPTPRPSLLRFSPSPHYSSHSPHTSPIYYNPLPTLSFNMRTSILFATLSAFALTSGVVAETSSDSTVRLSTH